MKPDEVLRVVLAGSSASDRDWVTELLRSASTRHCDFIGADTGESALRHVRAPAAPGDRLLLAAPLPDMDPLRLLACLADPQGGMPCPVVVITPGNGRDIGPLLLRAGAQDYIGEEWLSPYVLARAVDNALVRWAMERDLCARDDALQRSEAFARGVLNSLPQHVLVLDDRGIVQAANDAWDRFRRECGGGLADIAVGANYIEACHRAVQSGDASAAELLPGLQALMAGQAPECVVEYCWHCGDPASPHHHWFLLHARRPFHGRGLILSQIDISARKQAEEQLRRAQRLTQTIIDGAGALVFAKDLQGRYFLTNRAWRERVGLSEHEATGATDDLIYGVDVARTLGRNDQQVLASGRLMVAEEAIELRGRTVHYLSSKFPLLDEAGRAYAVCGVSTDVTSLKRTQAALQARERELQTLADNTPDILTRFDRTLRLVFVSAAIERMTGRSPRDFIGRTPAELDLPSDLRACWEQAIQAAFREGRPQVVDFSFEAAGGPRHFSGRFVPEFGPEGVIEHVLGVLHDDTEQKRAEQDINRLLEEERHYARLLARMAQAARLVHASLSADEIATVLTQQAREIIGARRAVTHLMVDGSGAMTLQAVEPAGDPALPDPAPGGMVLTAPLTGKGGQQLGLVQLSSGPDGTFTAEHQAVLLQLAAIASTGLENARLYASLREADHRKDEFLATLAHELRNPLAPIRNGLEILRRSGQLTGPAARARDMMERQLAHMVRLVDDLLDVSRISRGKVDLRLSRITLQTVLDNALEVSRSVIEASGHSLVLELPATPLWIDGDLTRLAQVVSNLLNNAAKYTPAGGRILLSARAEGARALIRVTDNGTGISADMLPRVFDLFAQVDRTLARSQGGLGIGLSLVKQLVELHGGDISAESAGLGQGSRFTVRLPLAVMACDAGTGGDGPSAARGPQPVTAPPCRVLVCDDNVDGADSLAMMLGLLGHQVRTVHEGGAALAVAADWRPEVILLDIGLPGLTGYDVARRLRADPAMAATLLVAVTGWGTAEDQRRSAAAGFDHHLTKPVEVSALEAVLARRILDAP